MTLPTNGENVENISDFFLQTPPPPPPPPPPGGGGKKKKLFSLKKNRVGILSFSSMNLPNFAKFLDVALSQN
jgi:hypothetical protein